MNEAVAYKILTVDQMARLDADGLFAGAPIDIADGYIHMSTRDQVAETAAKHFAGETSLVLAEVDLSKLGDTVRWEPSRGGALFPHIYGALPLAAVTRKWDLPLDRHDRHIFPNDL
ncbi:hypothetical protein CLG96_13945 [Sphingomonas oleivorans]|uniref:DUF952 domain-containing protein n=1 Tax=Sphingomonas oleivorans TaxID=1735121 RepID=A0A2T5FWP3_9SPHN|nr:DUF952 domain-containing protein [Sphingomonas oleivorans]PTQ10211.1 hypothetical protein CLG96_13945 [Sphingomonas oleivorans]